MKDLYSLLLSVTVLILSSASAQPYTYQGVSSEDIVFQSGSVQGTQNARLVGDLSMNGLYVLVGKIAKGIVFPGHTHSDARISTVISGVMYYGVGRALHEVQFIPYPAGSVIYTPANTPHFMWAKDGEIVVQETGSGPSTTDFLNKSVR